MLGQRKSFSQAICNFIACLEKFTHHEPMDSLERFLEGNEWSADVAETLETIGLAKSEIVRMTAKIDEIEDKIIEISFLMERQPDPKTDEEMFDWIGDL